MNLILKTIPLVFFTLSLFSFTAVHAQNTTIDSTYEEKESPNDDRIFSVVEEEATYQGGMTAWVEFLSKNLRASVPVNRHAPAGTYKVIIQFIVSKDGSLSNIEPLTHFGYGMEEEVIRILKKSHKWLPAVQNGRKVNAYRKQPVTFVVEEK